MLEHTTLEKVTSFTQAHEMGLENAIWSPCGPKNTLRSLREQLKQLISHYFFIIFHDELTEKRRICLDFLFSTCGEIFWDPNPEQTLVEEDKEWVTLCPSSPRRSLKGL